MQDNQATDKPYLLLQELNPDSVTQGLPSNDVDKEEEITQDLVTAYITTMYYSALINLYMQADLPKTLAEAKDNPRLSIGLARSLNDYKTAATWLTTYGDDFIQKSPAKQYYDELMAMDNVTITEHGRILRRMRKIVVLMMISLDGIMQAPGGSKEDEAEGFKYGGWTEPYRDKSFGPILQKELSVPFDLLLGRKTYKIWEKYWPKQTGMVADPFNKCTKYVVSRRPIDLEWKEAISINGDVVDRIKALKKENGPVFHVWGSSVLIQTLLKNDLVDELRLRIYPVTLGDGKRLFGKGTIPAAFELEDSKVLPSGIILANYKRAGELKTGEVA